MGHVTPSISLYNKAKQSKTMMLCSASRRRALGSRGLTWGREAECSSGDVGQGWSGLTGGEGWEKSCASSGPPSFSPPGSR